MIKRLKTSWGFHAHPYQINSAPEKKFWLMLAGRGAGKTRTGAEEVRRLALTRPGSIGALIAQDQADLFGTMLEGPSGIFSVSSPEFMPVVKHIGSRSALRWPNGTIAYLYSGDRPNQLRGPNLNWAWLDELAKWRAASAAWEQLELILRIPSPDGHKPYCFISTTPRPIKILRSLVKDPDCVVTKAHTLDNAANLDASFIKRIQRVYEGTRLGRQELAGELLDDVPGALWARGLIDKYRLMYAYTDPRVVESMARIVIAIDPAVTANATSDETGIVACGLGTNGRGYVLADASGIHHVSDWPSIVVNLYDQLRADCIVVEVNNGGDLVAHTIRTHCTLTNHHQLPIHTIHASRGKITRAEPVALLYERGLISHVGTFDDLEDQMCTFIQNAKDRDPGVDEPVPGESYPSPDRVDALVYGFTELFISPAMVHQGVVRVDTYRDISPY